MQEMDEDLQSSDDVVNEGVERCLRYLKGAMRKRKEGQNRPFTKESEVKERSAARQMEEREGKSEGENEDAGEETR
jgi:hypothetical protein